MEPSAIRSLPLGAADGFVLSRIDGRASERELAGLTGLPDMQIRSSLDKLFSLKAIEFGAPPPPPSKTSIAPGRAQGNGANGAPALGPAAPESDPRLAVEASGSHPALPAAGVVNALLEAAIADIPESSPELAEEVDLALELRRRVIGLHSVIASLDHYAILGLSREVDKKGVKRSYFELAAVFHPDRYFRKNLGSFKSKMEAIFAKVSTAYETLVDKDQRAEYDLYLGDVDKSRNIEAMLRNVMAEVETAEQTAIAEAGSPSLAPPPMPADSTPSLGGLGGPGANPNPITKFPSGSYAAVNVRSVSTAPPANAPYSMPAHVPPPPPSAPAAPARSPVADQLRREALAARLRGNRPITKPPIDVPPPPPSAPRSNPAEAVDSLKRRYEDRIEASRVQQGKKYVKIGQDAESRNDLTAAAAAYRVALTFLREDDPTYAHAKEIIAKSETSLGETYLRQAQHEERANRWEDAVRSYGRAVRLRPNDHFALERFANALVQSKGDLHEAAQHAQKAVQLSPTVGDYRCTLVNVYIAANLNLNAKREIEAAAALFPENPNVQALLKRLTKPV